MKSLLPQATKVFADTLKISHLWWLLLRLLSQQFKSLVLSAKTSGETIQISGGFYQDF
jgi:hypothetical protein